MDEFAPVNKAFVTFTEKLMSVFINQDVEGAVYWNANGDAFCILPGKYTEKVLKKHFQGTKLGSFARKLSRWGFERIVDHYFPACAVVYQHVLFQKGKPELVKLIGVHKKKQSSLVMIKSTSQGPLRCPQSFAKECQRKELELKKLVKFLGENKKKQSSLAMIKSTSQGPLRFPQRLAEDCQSKELELKKLSLRRECLSLELAIKAARSSPLALARTSPPLIHLSNGLLPLLHAGSREQNVNVPPAERVPLCSLLDSRIAGTRCAANRNMLQSSASKVDDFATLVATNQLQQLRREKETTLLEARLRLRQNQRDRLVHLAWQAESLKQQLEQEREREQRLLLVFLQGQHKR
jgi:hypothetical protein